MSVLSPETQPTPVEGSSQFDDRVTYEIVMRIRNPSWLTRLLRRHVLVYEKETTEADAFAQLAEMRAEFEDHADFSLRRMAV